MTKRGNVRGCEGKMVDTKVIRKRDVKEGKGCDEAHGGAEEEREDTGRGVQVMGEKGEVTRSKRKRKRGRKRSEKGEVEGMQSERCEGRKNERQRKRRKREKGRRQERLEDSVVLRVSRALKPSVHAFPPSVISGLCDASA